MLDHLLPIVKQFAIQEANDFLAKFGDWIDSSNAAELQDIFLQAALIRFSILCATDKATIDDLEEAYVRNERRLETIGFLILTVGKIESRQFFADTIAKVASMVPYMVGSFIKIGLPILLPITAPIDGVLGVGIEYILDKIMGVQNG